MTALLIIDVQNDFLPGGSLAVPDGDQIIPVINQLIPDYDLVVATQDYHPAGHKSFAANHADKKVGDLVELDGLQQVLWPTHCVQGTPGADFSDELDLREIDEVIQKGTDPEIDSYSGFFDNGHRKGTGLAELLRNRSVTAVDIVGLATDYCVRFTALDAIVEGFQTRVLKDGCRGVNLQPGDDERALAEVRSKGGTIH